MKLADIPVAILCGGLGTRIQCAAHGLPKALIPVAGRPFIDHQLDLLARNGARRVVLCVGYQGEQIEAHVGSGHRYGLDVWYSFDGAVPLGTGGALRRALPHLGATFLLLYGDVYLDVRYADLLEAIGRDEKLAMVAVYRNRNCHEPSNVSFTDGFGVRYDKRWPELGMHYLDAGATFYRASVVEEIPTDVPSDLSDLMHVLSVRGLLSGYEVVQPPYEIGSPAGLCKTEQILTHIRDGRDTDGEAPRP
jgi:NDP-sugar pyrophosphorylase family protein